MIKSFILITAITMLACGTSKEQTTKIEEVRPLREVIVNDWDKALADAKRLNKPIYVEFYTTWCGYCKVFERKTLKDEAVKRELSDYFVAVLMDAEQGKGIELAKQYKVNGYPTHIIVSSSGSLKSTAVGYLKPKPFLSWLEGLR